MKAVSYPSKIVSAQSLGASFTSSAIRIQQSDVAGLQLNYTGSPVGSFSIQGSMDHQENSQGVITNAGNWSDLPFTINQVVSTSIAVPTNTSPIILDMDGSSIPYIRVVYTRTSGTGSADLWFTGKRLGE